MEHRARAVEVSCEDRLLRRRGGRWIEAHHAGALLRRHGHLASGRDKNDCEGPKSWFHVGSWSRHWLRKASSPALMPVAALPADPALCMMVSSDPDSRATSASTALMRVVVVFSTARSSRTTEPRFGTPGFDEIWETIRSARVLLLDFAELYKTDEPRPTKGSTSVR